LGLLNKSNKLLALLCLFCKRLVVGGWLGPEIVVVTIGAITDAVFPWFLSHSAISPLVGDRPAPIAGLDFAFGTLGFGCGLFDLSSSRTRSATRICPLFNTTTGTLAAFCFGSSSFEEENSRLPNLRPRETWAVEGSPDMFCWIFDR
jgi:hypothetical protein